MIGPNYQRLAEIQQKMTAKQMLERIRNRPDNPLSRVVDKLKKQFSQYETAYSDPIMDYQITSIDRILSYDGKLGPILDALEKENLLLRKELGILEGQLSNTVGICEQILSENNELKLIIKNKNEDISKIIETIAGNQAEGMDQLEEKNALLIHQNSMLLRHLQEIKKEHQNYGQIFKDKDDEKSMMQKKMEEMKKQLGQSISRQRDLSRKISMLEQNLYQNSDELYQLQQNKQNLTFENNQLKNQVMLLEGKYQATGSQTLKRQIENQYQPIVEEHKLLKKQRVQLLRESEKLKLEKQKMEDLQAQLEQRLNKYSGDFDLTTSLLAQQKSKNASMNSAIGKLQTKLNQLKEQNNKLRSEKDTSNIYAVTRERRLLQQIEDLRKNLQQKQTEVQSRMRQIRESMQNLLQSKDLQLRKLREQNLQFQRLLQRH